MQLFGMMKEVNKKIDGIEKEIKAGTYVSVEIRRKKEEEERAALELERLRNTNTSRQSSPNEGKQHGKLFHTDSQRRIWKQGQNN